MLLAIEIGGTKLQLGVGSGEGGPLAAIERVDVAPERGADGVLRQIEQTAPALIQRHTVTAVGIGFGGPVDADAGRTVLSHQVEGWEDFPLADWCRKTLALPVVIGNDSDSAGLGEARFGAGKGHRVVFYTNVGSGIGGALVVDGQLYRGAGGIAAELGHLRPGPLAERPDQTVESVASGWGIAAAARARLADPTSLLFGPLANGERSPQPEAVRQRLIDREEADEEFAADLLHRCNGRAETLSAAMVAAAAAEGNRLALEVFDHACQTYGWAIAQMITLSAPDVVVIGGGVSLADETLLLAPLREYVDRYVFPPLKGSFQIVPSALGEEVVLHGALALAAGASSLLE
ncbi:MAG: ROK family protein [Candidatus Nealsonbacteria bacterium]|nr:ROK family protein [Candidatus Nealsonbacteria bacterium]